MPPPPESYNVYVIRAPIGERAGWQSKLSGYLTQKFLPVPPYYFDFFPTHYTLQYFIINSAVIYLRHLESSLDHLSNFSPYIIATGTDQG